MNKLGNILNESKEFNEILKNIGSNVLVVNGLGEMERRGFINAVSFNTKRPFVFVAQNEKNIQNVIFDFETLTGKEVMYFPSEDVYGKISKSKDIEINRAKIFEKLLKGDNPNIVTTLDVLFNKFSKINDYKDKILTLSLGETIEINKLQECFVDSGYEYADVIEGVGQFAVRGGIVDFYSPTMNNPVRIEFFGDDIDSIRVFDVLTQRTIDTIDKVDIFPVEASSEANDVSFLGYIPSDYLVFVEEPQRIIDKIETKLFELSDKVDKEEEETTDIEMPTKEELLEELFSHKAIFISTLETRLKDFSRALKFSMLSRELTGFANSFDTLTKSIKVWQSDENRIFIFAGTEQKAKNLTKELTDNGIENVLYVESIDRLPNYGSVYITKGNLSSGFEYPDTKTIVISDREVFGIEKVKKAPKEKSKALKVNIDELKPGEYVVHDKHGIGLYLGIETLDAGGVIKDYIKISYAKGDTLYVPVNQLDNVSKYIGADGKEPRLSKMGGQDWSKVTSRVKSDLREIAEELVKLYAEREVTKGFAFSEDTVWQSEFEEAFPYEETPDQLRCIEEIKKDMEDQKPMDRLLCGDVGYGKTEVAIRAAFKAVMDGKQVAYLAPTTVLTSQHYHSFVGRMKDYPVKIGMLSRLKSKAEQKEILKRVKSGDIDILIGTHRIVQKDVAFKDLGLLIIDEEQKFGVMDKEKIKMTKANVDVLTLSATPIPRTLNMSMVGVKDVSVIYEPPSNRSPVQTYVFEYDRGIIREAIRRELERNGQVYYLYNKVEDIDKVALKVQQDVPNARVVYAHGKLPPTELEDIMLKFSNHEYDVLVCTTIIDSGLDIPNVNTIVVENAENLGLSQLYQLRGRVGRSDRLAFAYITYRKDKVLSEIAEKRLKAIKEFTEFGSGIKIAMRDLEIRGAGSLIGEQQHGHLSAVGYETYCKLLAETIKELKGGTFETKEESTQIDLNINAYISEKYIKNEIQKMEMYQKISKVSNEEELSDIIDELTDRFGDIPKETLRLLNIVEIKYMANDAGVKSIYDKTGNVVFEFNSNKVLTAEEISKLLEQNKGKIMISAGSQMALTLKREENEDELLRNVKFVLQSLILLNNKV
ncbi:MAG: transcription-repair coupling factor [Clostridia bacterium]|nr:transcription-repair coupling factor [Clostridia bacterium]